jgi:hypothetical protein
MSDALSLCVCWLQSEHWRVSLLVKAILVSSEGKALSHIVTLLEKYDSVFKTLGLSKSSHSVSQPLVVELYSFVS